MNKWNNKTQNVNNIKVKYFLSKLYGGIYSVSYMGEYTQ